MTLADERPPVRVARVIPDVTGLDKEFDYLVPDALRDRVDIGVRVRVPLHGRRVGGWVVALAAASEAVATERLVDIAAVSSLGPDQELVSLAEWAAVRWGAPRLRPFLVQSSPPVMVPTLPPTRRTIDVSGEWSPGVELLCIAPLTDPLPELAAVVRTGPTVVVHPSPAAAKAVANRLRKAGFTVALLPDQWAEAAAGVDVVVGARGAVWARCPGLRNMVVLDEHDESLQDERTPTWHARDVAIERCARVGARCVLLSPWPTVTAVHAATRVVRPSASEMAGHWPFVDVVDRTDEPPWSRTLVSSSLVASLRDHSKRVVCVLNTTGRARLLACRGCRTLQRCTVCDAAVSQRDSGEFVCGRCADARPAVCQSCGSSAMANVKPGVTRLREELEAAAQRPVVSVTGATDEVGVADVYVGTEAVLHRVRDIDVVCFLDADAELLAPRYRATEHFMALVVRAGRLVGTRARGGVVMVQTHVPTHPALRAAVLGDPSRNWDAELERRQQFGLPPFGALASVEGAGAAAFVADAGLPASVTDGRALVRATSWMELGGALAAAPRPKGSRLRVEVDPPRV